MSDFISRADAIIAIKNLYPGMPVFRLLRDRWMEENKPYMECERAIRNLPPAEFCENCGADMRPIGKRLNDAAVEDDLFPELTAEEKAANKAEAKHMSVYPCADCRWSPPSSLDGKPCCACDPDDPLMNCYEKREEDHE